MEVFIGEHLQELKAVSRNSGTFIACCSNSAGRTSTWCR
jgi:hypothetical protein